MTVYQVNGSKLRLQGEQAELSEVADDVFAKEVLGKGAAIFPRKKDVCMHRDLENYNIFETGHAIGMKLDNGAEV